MSWLLTFVMIVGLLPIGMVTPAAAAGTGDGNTLTEEEANMLLAGSGKSLVQIALENNLVACDTEKYGMCGGNSHLQGICVDDEMEYMYFSYTSALAKIDIATGELVASIGGFGGGSFGTNGGAHLGCIDYYDGYIYGSLEYKSPGKKFYLAIFDADRMTEVGVSIQDSDYDWDNPICTAVLLAEPTVDFRDPINTSLFVAGGSETPGNTSAQDSHGHASNEANNGHWFACSGIDGVTMGKWPGGGDDELYMIVAYGVYQFSSSPRQDNTYNVLQYYKFSDIWNADGTQTDTNITFTYADGISTDWAKDETIWQKAAKTLYVYTGNTSYGAQNIEYEWDSGDLVLYTYGNTDGFGKTMYVVDGSVEPTMKALELGQSNTITDEAQSKWVADVAKAYADYPGAEVGDDGYMEGYVAELKCVCGDSGSHSAEEVADAEWGTTGVKKADQPICSRALPQSATTGIHWLGTDAEDEDIDYFYIANGTYHTGLYKRTTAANGSMSYEKVTPNIDTTAKELVHLSMDAEDLYEKGGVVYLRNSSGTGDAIVEGTTSGNGVSGGAGSALSFDAWKYPDRVDRVYLSEDTIEYINKETDASLGYGNYSYSFWAKMPEGKESDGNFIPYIGFYREDGTYASVFEKRWRSSMGHVTNGVGPAAPGAGNISSSTYNPSNSDPGDYNTYLGGYGKVYPADAGWHFYTVTENCGAITVYYDGVKMYDKTVPSDHLTSEPFAYFEIGGGVEKLWQDMNNRGRFIGEIDDVTIYSGVLTADQVAAAYNSKPADAESNPAHPGVETDDSADVEYAVYDLTADAGKDLTVDAGVTVSQVLGLTKDADYAVNGTEVTFKAAWLAKQTCGILNLTVNDSTSLKLTITDKQVPVLKYSLAKSTVFGSVVEDQSAYGVDAIANNITEFSKDHTSTSNGAMVFDGYDYNEPTYVKLADEDADWLNSVLKDGYSINVWAKATAENGNKMTFLGLYAGDARPVGALETYDTNESTGANNKIDGVMTIRSHVGVSGTSSSAAVSGTTVNKGDWAMYTISYDKTDGLTLYINGTQVANTAVTAAVLGQIDQFFIGHQYQKYYYNDTNATADWTTRGGFYGMMSDLSVYNYALSAEEVTTLYGGGSITPAQKTAPLIHWTMDANTLSGDGTILESSNGYTSYYQNVTPVAGVDGKEGGALYFNGAADSGEAARVWLGQEGIEAINESISNQVTMSFWMKADTTKTNEQLAYTAAWSPVAGIYGTDTRFLMVAEYRSGNVNYCATIPGLSDQRINRNVVNPANDQWYFVVMTWDGETTETVANTQSVLRDIYVFKPDGTVVVGTPDRAAATSNANTGKLFDSIGHVEIGGQNSKGYWSDTNVRGRFVGAIDDVKVYNVPFIQKDAETMYANKPVTNNELYLPEYQFEVKISDTSDLTFTVENAGTLTGVSGLSSREYSMSEGVVTLDHDAVVDLGLGDNLLTLTFANGTSTIKVTVVDDREYFNADTTIFDKASPADLTFSVKTSFGSEIESVSADGLTEDDYVVSGRSITVKGGWLVQQQPGAVEITIKVPSGETRVMALNITNTLSNDATEPYPVLYYKMDSSDLVEGEPPVNGAAAGIIKDCSGNGIDLQYGGLTKTDANKNKTADSAVFFDGYRDYDVSRAWLDEGGMDYLKDAVSNQITISFWHKSDRITSNYMPILGLFAENNRPLIMAEFREFSSETGERTTIGTEAVNPVLTAVPSGSVTLADGVLKAANEVTMNSTWHHYVLTYHNTTGAAVLYVDGTQAGTATLSAGQLDDMAKFEIGGMTNAEYYNVGKNMSTQSHGRLYGNLDEVRVYNVVLSAEDVADLYAVDVDDSLPVDKTGVKVLDSIEITAPTKTQYNVGGTLDLTGGTVTIKYEDGTSKTIDMTVDMVSGFDSSLGVMGQELTVSYTHNDVTKTATFTVDIVKALESIAIKTLPGKLVYEVGEELDVTGGEITLTYDDGTTEDKTLTADMISGFDSSKGGSNLLTVTYEGKTTNLGVTIGKRLSAIAVTTLPEKVTYGVGEDLDVTGGKVTLTYNDETTEEIALEAGMVTGFDSDRGGTVTLTVSYGEFTDTYDVTVVKALASIRVSGLTTTYRVGGTLDVDGATVVKVYDDGTEESVVLTEDMVSGFDSSAAGTNTITVTYEGKTTTVDLTIKKYSSGGSSSGGSSSGSSSAGSSTTTEKNDDGSVTTTTTDKKTGEVTETTKTTNGVTGTTVTDKKGNVTEVSATVPSAAAKEAEENGGAVTLPIRVEAASDAGEAVEIEVNVPSKGATVEIPVGDVTPGTVVVIVNKDGTEEIVKTSVVSEDGVVVTLDGDATVKIVDNSKHFVDVHPVNHWAEDSIDFVTARELFNGKTANTFEPNATTTRGQLMTVLARLDGADTSSAPIQKGMEWAVEYGISDGTNPGNAITRQQLAVMLWRYAGMPESDHDIGHHTDANHISDYAETAMAWAIEHGILTGYADGSLKPHNPATRAHVATMMARFVNQIA